MKRIGPWMVCGALALMALGIFSTPRPGTYKPERELRIDMAGVTTVDIGFLNIDNITLQSGGTAVMRYEKSRHQRDEPDVEPKHIDQTLVFNVGRRSLYYGEVQLTLPADVAYLKGRRVKVEAKADIGTLRIDANVAYWTGNANQLDVHLEPRQSGNCPDRNLQEASFDFSAGKVARLKIVAPKASVVTLGDISHVGDIELHAGPNVRVEASLADFATLRVIPIDELPAPAESLASSDTDCRQVDSATGLVPLP